MLDARIVRDQVEISINTSQNPLHQRGYRLQTAKAPLREDLAYAMLWSSGWKPAYHSSLEGITKYEAFLDPFCGSGTIAIEAAAMRAGIPPGRLRPAPLMGTLLGCPVKWNALTEPQSWEIVTSPFQVYASDRDAGAIGATEANAKRAGVFDLLDISDVALSSQPWLESPGVAPKSILVATNPPFGKRISPSRENHSSDLLPLFQTLGHRLNRLVDAGCEVGVTILSTPEHNMRRKTGIPLELLFRSTHGGLSVTAMHFYSEKHED